MHEGHFVIIQPIQFNQILISPNTVCRQIWYKPENFGFVVLRNFS